MKRLVIRSIFPVLGISFLLFITSCRPTSTDNDAKKVQEVNATLDKQKGTFNPAFLKNRRTVHFAATVDFDNGAFQLGAAPISTRAGRLPYLSTAGGDFMIEYKDQENRTLGRYFMQNPTTLRSCDQGDAPFVKTINKGSFELLLPANRAIRTVEFYSQGKPFAKLAIPADRLEATDARTEIQ